MTDLLVQFRGISKTFGTTKVLEKIDLDIHAGHFYALIGRNGVGKSTLIKLLMRSERPEEGTGVVLGRPMEMEWGAVNADIGYVSETLNYQVPHNIKKLFSWFPQLYPRWDQDIFDGVLDALRINQDKHFGELSRGQKMQVALAQALAIKPKLLLIDEITAVLDAHARAYFMKRLRDTVLEGASVLMATNIVSEVEYFADHLLLMDEMKIKIDLPLSEIANKFLKLRKKVDVEHPAFADSSCRWVGINSDRSVSFLMTKEDAVRYQIAPEMVDNRAVRAEEIFIYFTERKME